MTLTNVPEPSKTWNGLFAPSLIRTLTNWVAARRYQRKAEE